MGSEPGVTDEIELLDGGRAVGFTFEQMIAYHGSGSPGGVAHAYKVLERAVALLAPGGAPERRELTIHTAFAGPGARDGFELVTRAVTEGRYYVDPSLALPELGRTRERFVFVLGYRDRELALALRDGYVSEEFIDLARDEPRTPGEDQRLALLKTEMADRLMTSPADDVYEEFDPRKVQPKS